MFNGANLLIKCFKTGDFCKQGILFEVFYRSVQMKFGLCNKYVFQMNI
jgi:hypothetical protein